MLSVEIGGSPRFDPGWAHHLVSGSKAFTYGRDGYMVILVDRKSKLFLLDMLNASKDVRLSV